MALILSYSVDKILVSQKINKIIENLRKKEGIKWIILGCVKRHGIKSFTSRTQINDFFPYSVPVLYILPATTAVFF